MEYCGMSWNRYHFFILPAVIVLWCHDVPLHQTRDVHPCVLEPIVDVVPCLVLLANNCFWQVGQLILV